RFGGWPRCLTKRFRPWQELRAPNESTTAETTDRRQLEDEPRPRGRGVAGQGAGGEGGGARACRYSALPAECLFDDGCRGDCRFAAGARGAEPVLRAARSVHGRDELRNAQRCRLQVRDPGTQRAAARLGRDERRRLPEDVRGASSRIDPDRLRGG